MNATTLVDFASGSSRHLLEVSQDSYASVFPLGTVRCWITFLVCVVASSQLGGVFTFVGLPLITGYMIIGAVVGPQILNLIQHKDLLPLGLVTQGALAFICFSAGAELYLPELRALFRQIMYQTSMTAFVTFFLCTFAIVWAAPLLPFLNALRFHHCRGSIAAVAASIMVARSPASAIAIVKEQRAKGTFTSAVLGMTVLGDLYVLILFSITTSIARTTCDNERFSIFTVLVTLGVLLLSIVIGWFVGRFLMFLMLFKSYVQRYLILPLGLGIFVFSHWLAIYTSRKYKHFAITLESLLICIVAGYVCTNNSGHRNRFILVLGKLGPYVFLPFFTLTGASLNLKVLAQSFGFAAVIAFVRALCVFIGSAIGGYLAGVRPLRRKENMLMWMALLTQAGVSLGLASEMAVLFPSFGPSFQSSLIAVILINQVVGPVLFRVAMRVIGDAGKANSAGDEYDEDAVVPIALVLGASHDALAVASRLLVDNWAVTMACATQADADHAAADIKQFGKSARAHLVKADETLVQHIGDAAKKVVSLPGHVIESAATAAAQRIAHLDMSSTATTADLEATPLMDSASETVELDEHGHPVRKLEDRFTTMVVALDLNQSDVLVKQLSDLVATLDAKRLSAFVLAFPDDAANLPLASSLRTLVESSPKKSPLREVRFLALLQCVTDAENFEKLNTMPVHATTHSALVAAKLLGARLGNPVNVFAAASSATERCKAVSAVLSSSPGDDGQVSGGRAAAIIPDSPLLATLKAKVPRSFAALMRDLKTVIALEDEGDPAGLEGRPGAYMDQLTALHENAPVGDNLLGAVSARSRAAGLAEVALYESMSSGASGSGDARGRMA